MKVSLKFAQQDSNVELAPSGVAELVKKIGAQLGAVDEVIDYGSRYDGIIVAKIISCEKHPNADKLHVCLIDDGGAVKDVARDNEGLVEVVCGAPNVAVGQTVAWIPPGATVPSTIDKDPFVLESKEIRGVASNGMIASASELAISDDHSGIVVINAQDVGEELTKPGTEFKKLYGLDDIVIDIENKMFTHRPDCFGALGIARELAGIQRLKFESPNWYRTDLSINELPSDLNISVENKLVDKVPRFVIVPIKDVEIKPSPLWMQAGLNRVGIRPINNIVDVTNYVMYLTGQPLHAYDYDKLVNRAGGKDPKIIIRSPEQGEKLTLLNGKTIKLEADNTILIADEAGAIGLGGVMGGHDTEVDENTKNIVIECANFDMFTIRRMSMNYGIFSDAVTRFNKGQSPLQNVAVISYAIDQITQLSNGYQAGSIIDVVNRDQLNTAGDGWNDKEVTITGDFIRSRLGITLPDEDILNILKNVEFGIDQKNREFAIYSPFWRTDINIKEDIVEEVGRLYGYDHLPLELPKRSISPTDLDRKLTTKAIIRNALASFGANEILTYSFVHGNLIKNTGQDEKLAFKLSNALSPDLQYYRLSLTPSLLSNIHPNIKSGHEEFALFEINKTHNKSHVDDIEKIPTELEMISLVYAHNKSKTPGYFQARVFLDSLAKQLGIPLSYRIIGDDADFQEMKPFDIDRSSLVYIANTDVLLGTVGEFDPSVNRSLKLPASCAGFEIGLESILAYQSSADEYEPLSKYPSTLGDITLEIGDDVNFAGLSNFIDKILQENLQADQYVSLQPIDIFTSEKIQGKKRITFRVSLTSYSHTLTDKVLSDLLDTVSESLHTSLRAIRI